MGKKKTLIKNADWIITMDAGRTMLPGADLLVSGQTIEKIGRNLQVPEQDLTVVDARGRIVIPGMVNTHHHCAHTVVRNMAHIYELRLHEWLKRVYAVLQYFDEDTLYAATLGGLGDLLKTGCTTSVDHSYVFPAHAPNMVDAQVRAAKKLNIRLHLMRGSLSVGAEGGCEHVPPALVETVQHMAEDSARVIEAYHDTAPGAMLQVGLAPCWFVYETEDMLRESLRLAQHYKVKLHSHLADSRAEYAFCTEKHGCTPTEYAEQMGYLQPGNFFAHCIQLTRSDMSLLAKNRVGVCHCPNSDMVLRSGVAKLPEFLRRRIHVGLGVDGSASNNLSNMIAEMKSAYVIQKSYEAQREREAEVQSHTQRLEGITPENILYTATVGGAKTLGRDDIGYLAPGMMADFVLLDWSRFQYAGGKYDPIAAIVLSGDARMIDKVFVNGRQAVEGGALLGVDEQKAAAYINGRTRALFRRYADSGHSIDEKWRSRDDVGDFE